MFVTLSPSIQLSRDDNSRYRLATTSPSASALNPILVQPANPKSYSAMSVCCLFRATSRLFLPGKRSLCCRRLYSTESKARHYTRKHEWVSVNENVGTIGISSYAQDALGEVVFVQLPDVGKVLAAGDESGALESVKAASEVYTPVSGTVIEKNTAAESTPSLINKSCYEEGWLFKVKLSKPEEVQTLMDQSAYDSFLKESH